MNKIEELMQTIHDFADKRNWLEFNNSKDLALSIVLEASELLENFQWVSHEEANIKNIQNIKEELADVFIYCISFADKLGINIEEIILEKLKKNALKYPEIKRK